MQSSVQSDPVKTTMWGDSPWAQIPETWYLAHNFSLAWNVNLRLVDNDSMGSALSQKL